MGENRDPRRGGLLISFHSLQDGGTPLHLAALNDQAEATRLLLEAGADPKLKNKVRGIVTGWDVLGGPMATNGSFVRLSVGGVRLAAVCQRADGGMHRIWCSL